jgi:glucose/arabinose dehydrogenase
MKHTSRQRRRLATGIFAAAAVGLSSIATGVPAAAAAGATSVTSAAVTCLPSQLCEAEQATLRGGAGIASNHPGYSGTGFVDGMGNGGAGLLFDMQAATAGSHRVTIRYANWQAGDGETKARTLTLVAGGENVQVQLPTTGGWDRWGTVAVPVTLPAGASTLDLHVGAGNDGHVNIDSLLVQYAGDQPVTEQGVTMRIFDIGFGLQNLCVLKPGQTPNVDVLRPVIDWTTSADWGGYTSNYQAQVVADIDVAEAGTYTFRLESDDGSRLYVDGQEVINHDGLHARTAKDGDITLTAGKHALEIRYFQAGGGAELALSWRKPGSTTFELVPNSVLTTEGGGARVVSPGIKECEGLSDGAGDGLPLTKVHPSFDLTNLRPDDTFRPDVSGLAFYGNGDVAVLTWGAAQVSTNGKLYRVTNVQGDVDLEDVTYTEVANGLQEPQGVAVVDGETYISSKVGLEKLVDADGDGFFEGRQRIATWPNGNNFHEFAFGLPYKDGHFYVALSVALERSGNSTVPQPGPDRGTVLKINKDTSEIEYIAGGLRTPNGINFDADGNLLITDNQGGWVPANKLVQIKQGAFYNHYTTYRDPETGEMIPGRFDDQPVTQPVVWMPQNEIANSPSTPVTMTEGPFAGQLAIGDVTYGGLQRVFTEEVDGQLQGALYRMTQGLEAGVNELLVGPDGALYIGGIGYDGNWNQPGKLRYGFQKLSANDTVTMDILKTEITEDGFDLTYTKPLSDETVEGLASAYQVRQWRYNPTSQYGGPKIGEESLAVSAATVSEDRKTVSLDVEGVKPGYVVHIRSPRPFTAADGEELWSTEVWYTANAVPGYEPPADLGYYEAEEAMLAGGAGIANEHNGYSGVGFVDGFGSQGASLTFTVNAEAAGVQPVHLRYANGPNPFSGNKTVSLYVNGAEVDPLVLPPTSTVNWRTWAFITRQLDLRAGANTISIRFDQGDDGNVNFDVLKLGEGQDICTPTPADEGYTSLFDGTLASLTEWEMAGPGSFGRQADCTLRTEGGLGLLYFPEEFESYSLTLDWKLVKDDNSGIFVGFPDPGTDPNVAINQGYEIQIDASDDPDSTTGAIYNFQAADIAARDAALKPVGSWNSYEIRVQGQNIKVFLNGTLVNDFTSTDPARDLTTGFVGIQNHGGGENVYFRDIQIRDLEDSGEAPTLEVTSPADGALIDDATTTVTGTTDAAQVEVRVGTQVIDATVANGTFTAEVPLSLGVNTVTVIASTAEGATATERLTVVSRGYGTLVGAFTDPAGDDNGPGSYRYPTDQVFKAGSLDLLTMEVYEDGDNVRFVAKVNGEIVNPWGGDQLSHQRLNIYVGNGEGGAAAAAALPGTNMSTASPWQAAIVVDGRFSSAGVYRPDGTKVDGGTLFAIPQTQELGITVPRSALQGIDLSSARYGTAMFMNAEGGEGIGFVRPVLAEVQQWRLGGGAGVENNTPARDSDTRDPNALDIIVGAGQTQAEVMNWQVSSPSVLPMLALAGAGDTEAPVVSGNVLGTATGYVAPIEGRTDLPIAGTATLVKSVGGTSVSIRVAGLDPAKTYPSHLHVGTCADMLGHYKHDPDGAPQPPNELWLSSSGDPLGPLVPNADGVAAGSGSADWVTRQGPLSVMVHDGPPIACVDLSTYTAPVTVDLTADDGEGSGVASVEYRLDTGEWTAYDGTFTVAESGEHTVAYRATDAEGNVSEEASLSFTIAEQGSFDTLVGLVGQFNADGTVSDKTVANLRYVLDRAVAEAARGSEVRTIMYLEQFVSRASNQVKGDDRDVLVRDMLVAEAQRLIAYFEAVEAEENDGV